VKSFLPSSLAEYARAAWNREPEILAELRAETSQLSNAGMQISPEQGQLMGLLAALIGTERYLEIGTFTGYSSLSVMLNVGPSATADCLDVSEEFTSMAVRYWNRAQLSDRIHLHLGPATDTLLTLKPGYDLAFIDADKPNYPAYFEACLKLVRQGGLILVDNVLWDGKVADPEAVDEDTSMFRQFNDAVRVDPRVDLALIPIADGLTICRVR